MKSLQDEIRERRPADSAALACVSIQPGSPGLVVCQWEGECWVMPWAQFVSARLAGPKDEQLELTFANYRVVMTGENLRGLLDDLAMQRVACVRDLPGSYRSQAKAGEPFIAQIEVMTEQSAAALPVAQR